MKEYNIEFLPVAWEEIEDIANYYLQKIGPRSSVKIFDKIMAAIERLKVFPLSCPLIYDESLKEQGYRMLVCDDYICVYRLIEETVYIYHISNGRTDYYKLL